MTLLEYLNVMAFIEKYGIQPYAGPYQDQMGKYIFFKTVSKEYGSLWMRWSGGAKRRGIPVKGTKNTYRPSTRVLTTFWTGKIAPYSTDEESCGPGLHIGTLNCTKAFLDATLWLGGDEERRIVRVLVYPEDIVSLDTNLLLNTKCSSEQKLRCTELYVLDELTISQ